MEHIALDIKRPLNETAQTGYGSTPAFEMDPAEPTLGLSQLFAGIGTVSSF